MREPHGLASNSKWQAGLTILQLITSAQGNYLPGETERFSVKDLTCETMVQVRPTDFDPLNHVNNSKYLEYLEMGRTDWYEHIGFGIEKKRRLGIETVQVNININFRREINSTGPVIVITRPLRRGHTSFVLHQVIRAAKDEQLIHAEATVTNVVFDVTAREKRPLPPELADVFSQVSETATETTD